MKILVAGASGLLGGAVYRILSEKHFVIGTFCNSEAPYTGYYIWRDLTFYDEVKDLLLKYNFDAIVNCAANTDIDYCEENKKESSRINMDFPSILGDLFSKKIIHISSPAVFPGIYDKPYEEEDETYPVNQYGFQKEQAEKALEGKAIILRADFYDRLAEFFLRNATRGNKVGGFKDVIFSPISAFNYAKIIDKAIDSDIPNGIYHAGGKMNYSKYGFGLALVNRIGADPSLVYAKKSDFKTPRPKNTSLNSNKLYSLLGIDAPKLFERIYENW